MTTELLEIEKAYLEKLNIINSELSPQWLKEQEDNSNLIELLNVFQDIQKVHTEIYNKLETLNEIDDGLVLYLIEEIKSAYSRYSDHFICNLSQCQDILCTPSIKQKLSDLNQHQQNEISLDTLFDAPLKQLIIYKSYFNEITNTLNPSTLLQANQLFDTLMNSIIRLDPIDTSNVVDLFTEKPILNYQLEPISKILFKHTFYCIELEEHVQVLLTKTHLVISTDNNHLLCPSILIDHVRVRSTQSDCNDEYWLQFLIQERKALTLKTSSKEDRDLWLVSTQPSAWSPLEQTVISRSRPKPIKTTDIFSFYNDPEGGISPLESSDEEDSTSDTKREEYTYSATPSDTMQKAITPSPPPLPQHSQVPDPTLNKPLPVRNHSLKQLPATPPETITTAETITASQKKPSFMRSVLSVVGSPRLRKSQSITPLPRQAPITLNQSSVSLDRQTIPTPQRNSSLLDPAQQPRGSYLLHHQSSNSSFSSSQSSLATPPLSRSSSPGSSTPISRLQTPTSLSSAEDLEDQQRSTPPASPDMQLRNTIKQVIYRDDQCQVFHWKDESWYAVEDDQCVLEVRQTYSNRTCITIHMMNTRQMYLNAWILPDTSIQRISDTDINLTVQFGGVEDNYLFHCATKDSASQLDQVLQQVHLESAQLPMTDTVRGSPPLLDEPTQQEEDLEKSLKLALQCKCKLYIQSSSAKWSSFGSVHMKVSQHYTTKKMHMAIESHKGGKVTKLVSAMVQSRNVERLGPKRITFLFVNDKTSVVYMVQVREELTGDKIIEYLKEKNAENGW